MLENVEERLEGEAKDRFVSPTDKEGSRSSWLMHIFVVFTHDCLLNIKNFTTNFEIL